MTVKISLRACRGLRVSHHSDLDALQNLSLNIYVPAKLRRDFVFLEKKEGPTPSPKK